MLHELGHNLGLHHGGNDGCEGKPNYISVMNDAFLYGGIDVDCDRLPDGVDKVGFSDGTRRPLLKAALFEPEGVCPASHPLARPLDWNANAVIDPFPVAATLVCSEFDLLENWNDIGEMWLALYGLPNAAEPPPMLTGVECPSPPVPGDDP